MEQKPPTDLSEEKASYDQLLEQLFDTSPQVAIALTRAHRDRTRELDRYLNADTLRRRFPGKYFEGLEEVFSVLDAIAAAYRQSPVLKDIAFLLERVRADLQSAIDAGLAGFNGIVLDTMRDAMEVEYVLRDFQHDDSKINTWLHADRATLMRDFSPRALRSRHAAALGTVPEKLPDAAQYRIHSQALHVSPSFILSDLAGKGFTEVASPRASEFCFAEIFEHARCVILAAYDLGVSQEGSGWTGPDARAGMPEAARAWERTQAVTVAMSLLERAAHADIST